MLELLRQLRLLRRKRSGVGRVARVRLSSVGGVGQRIAHRASDGTLVIYAPSAKLPRVHVKAQPDVKAQANPVSLTRTRMDRAEPPDQFVASHRR